MVEFTGMSLTDVLLFINTNTFAEVSLSQESAKMAITWISIPTWGFQ